MIRRTIYFLFSIIITLTATAQEAVYHFDSDKIIYKDLEYFGTLSKSVVKEQVQGVSQLNFNPAISFNGVADYLKVNPELYSGFTQMTAITVFCPFGNAEEDIALWELDSEVAMSTKKATSRSMELEYEGIEMDKPLIHTYVQYYKKNNRFLSTLLEELSIGQQSFTNTPFKGQIAELILFNKALNEEELQKITSSLALKYGISLKENQDYIASDSTIIWEAEKDSLFSHRITGIGCDAKSHLLQKQSTNAENPGFLTIGVEAIAPTNNDNVGRIIEQNYLIWGDNNQAFELNNTESNTQEKANTLPVTKRKWLMKATGINIEEINTQLKIDASSVLDETITNLLLVINENGNEQFNKNNPDLRYVFPASLDENGIITYNNIKWDSDQSGKDIFAFIGEKQADLPELDENNTITKGGQEIHFGIYPNVTDDGNFSIVMQFEKEQDVQVRVYDMAGKQYTNKRLKGSEFYFLKNEFIGVSGIFNVVMNSGDIQLTKRLIVQ